MTEHTRSPAAQRRALHRLDERVIELESQNADLLAALEGTVKSLKGQRRIDQRPEDFRALIAAEVAIDRATAKAQARLNRAAVNALDFMPRGQPETRALQQAIEAWRRLGRVTQIPGTFGPALDSGEGILEE